MAWWKVFLGPGKGRTLAQDDLLAPADGYGPASLDTMAAISELSRVVRDNPDAVEIYLALGNLYRSHGEIERAVQIRNNLIVRPGLDNRFKARALYELGRDFKRGGFFDRALRAFENADSLWPDNEAIVTELARLSAETGRHEQAARFFARLDQRTPQAHYLVRLAKDAFAEGDESTGNRWLTRGFKVYPGSAEAWLCRIETAYQAEEWKKVGKHLRQAMEAVPREMRFVLMEGLMHVTQGLDLVQALNQDFDDVERRVSRKVRAEDGLYPVSRECTEHDKRLHDVVLPILEDQPPELLLGYYVAWLHILCGDMDQAQQWLERTLLTSPDFWPARLELLAIGASDQSLSPVFQGQLGYFIAQARQVKRFLCRSCGLKREQIFFTCPRCQSWHSIGFRGKLTD